MLNNHTMEQQSASNLSALCSGVKVAYLKILISQFGNALRVFALLGVQLCCQMLSGGRTVMDQRRFTKFHVPSPQNLYTDVNNGK